MMTNNVLSPVTKNDTAKLVDVFPVETIISLYKSDFDLNVERFFTGLREVSLYECTATGYRFYYPFTLPGDGDFYEELLHQKKRVRLAFYKPLRFEHEFALKRIGTGVSVLDIGCGEGFFLEQLKDRTNKLFGLETYDVALEASREKGIDARKEFIEDHEKEKIEIYDVITAFQVLEHVYDIKSFLDNATRLLKKGGKLYLATPNNDPWFQQYNKYSTLNLPPHHMGLWNEKSFRNMGNFFGLRVNQIEYDEKINWKINAYYRVRCWLNIKTPFKKHTTREKIAMLLLSPFAGLFSLINYSFNRVKGYNIVIEFIKE
jgi:2-polyprenyl-3-methyl-5-hydroxy-6-metoxy-1,4-benzoquinol methylase